MMHWNGCNQMECDPATPTRQRRSRRFVSCIVVVSFVNQGRGTRATDGRHGPTLVSKSVTRAHERPRSRFDGSSAPFHFRLAQHDNLKQIDFPYEDE